MHAPSLTLVMAMFAGVLLPQCAPSPEGAPTTSSVGAPTPALIGDQGADAAAPPSGEASPSFSPEERALLAAMAPAALPQPPSDPTNGFADNPAAARLGQKLFFDPLFSGALLDGDNDGSSTTLGKVGDTGKVACVGCHVPSASFLDNRTLGQQISLAAGWVLRRTPSLLDVGHAKLVTWDGHRDSLFAQVFGPIESRDEMNSSRLFYAEQVFARYRAEYEALFGAMPPLDVASRFPPLSARTTGCRKTGPSTFSCHGMPGDGAEFDGMTTADQKAVTRVVVNAGKAMGAYERLLSCGPGRFDQWAHGQSAALDASEQRGAKLFVGKARCATCHSGPFLTDQGFHNVGLRAERVAVAFIDAADPGASVGMPQLLADPLNSLSEWSDGHDNRVPSSVPDSMAGAFRTPSLRCVSMRPSFMHTGHMKTLAQVISFFERGGDPAGYPGHNELVPLRLTETERVDLERFLRALDGPGPAEHLRQPIPLSGP